MVELNVYEIVSQDEFHCVALQLNFDYNFFRSYRNLILVDGCMLSDALLSTTLQLASIYDERNVDDVSVIINEVRIDLFVNTNA